MSLEDFLSKLDSLAPRKEPRPFTLSNEERAELAKLSPADRELRLDIAIYAHIYREECRVRHVAVLQHHVEMALKQRWQTEREALIADAVEQVLAREAA